MEKLALLGGTPVLQQQPDELFRWPIMTQEDYDAAMDVVYNNKFSGTDITEKFQEEFAAWQGRKYAIAYCNGTMSLTAAMFAIGLGSGDEIICPTKTYWGSVSQAINSAHPRFSATSTICSAWIPATSNDAFLRAPRRLWWYTTLAIHVTWTQSWQSHESTI